MTSTSSEGAVIATLVKEQTFAMAEKYFEMATTALLIWHYVLTVDNELAFFRRRRFSSAYALFVANRYLILVVIIYQSPWWAVHYSHMWQCRTAIYAQYIFWYLQYLIWAAFTGLRAYALQMQWLWAALVLALSLGPVAYGTDKEWRARFSPTVCGPLHHPPAASFPSRHRAKNRILTKVIAAPSISWMVVKCPGFCSTQNRTVAATSPFYAPDEASSGPFESFSPSACDVRHLPSPICDMNCSQTRHSYILFVSLLRLSIMSISAPR